MRIRVAIAADTCADLSASHRSHCVIRARPEQKMGTRAPFASQDFALHADPLDRLGAPIRGEPPKPLIWKENGG